MLQQQRIGKAIIILFCVLGSLSFGYGQSFKVNRVDPPFWWTGMVNHHLELLVYGENLASSTVQVQGEGVLLHGVTQVENPNYLFLNLEILPEARPGEISLLVSKGGRTSTIQYELKARKGFKNRIQGVDASDLIYLIMPDRFANGDLQNDEVAGMYQSKASRTGQYQRHGGDLQGIIDHLDYLKDLGITTLWLNPAEENNQQTESYHGYAVTDHYRIDPRLGSNDTYLQLVDQCHQRGMKMIRDVVYNHVGLEHWLMKDMPSKNWVHQFDTFTKTTYRAPTLLDPYASDYDRHLMSNGWFDHHMPDLNQNNVHVANYLIQNSIWWIEHAGLDGYRIDTYAYPDQAFMATWAERILAEYPLFTFFGETWVHGVPVQAWFTAGTKNKEINSQMAGVTDFQLNYAIFDALNQDFGWTEGVARLYYTLAKDYVYQDPMQNVVFLDNHDIGRYFSGVGENMDKFKMGIGFLLTTRGIPQLYYGTEILMKNYFDPSDHDKVREEFPGGWEGDKVNKFLPAGRNAQEQEAFDFVRTLANFRKESVAIGSGKLMQFVPEDGVYVYFRYHPDQTVMVIMNQNDEAKELDMKRYQERLVGFSSAKDVMADEKISDLSRMTSSGKSIRILELKE